MKRFGLLVTAAFALTGVALAFALARSAPATEPTSAALLTGAEAQAKREHKNVMVIFHASWCGWCKRLDGFLADPSVGKLMTDNYVIVHVDVMENGDKKALENPGGGELMKQWNGEGLPFTTILDPNGNRLADSNLDPKKPSNIGYPGEPQEIVHFMKMLKTAPHLTSVEANQIETWLKAHAPKPGL